MDTTNGHVQSTHGDRRTDAGEAFTSDELDTVAETLVTARMNLGLVKADADWIDHPLDDWLMGLDSPDHRLDRESVSRLAVGMKRSLAMRDALIISMVSSMDGDHPAASDKAVLIDLASRPHAPRNVQRMSRLLAQTFQDEHVHADIHRCAGGVRMLLQMIDVIPQAYAVQPHAVVAYVSWWMGDERAIDDARIALDSDDRCTLAAIVCSALRHGISPAWSNSSKGVSQTS